MSPAAPPVTIDDIVAARSRIEPFVHRTPIMTSRTLDERIGASVSFKCENLQKVGAFKARGALNAVLALEEASAARGVVTHSSGNHGAALAYAASIRGVPCTVVMPEDAPQVKFDAVAEYGARIVTCRQAERAATAAAEVDATGGVMVHPFEDPHVIAGQGTAALELMEDVPDLDLVVTPVGGGGASVRDRSRGTDPERRRRRGGARGGRRCVPVSRQREAPASRTERGHPRRRAPHRAWGDDVCPPQDVAAGDRPRR